MTGGAGFIGANIAAVLEARGLALGPVAVVDEMGLDGQWRNIAKRSLHSIVAPRDLWAYLASCPEDTAIIHMAALSSTAETDASALAQTNVGLTVSLFEHCAKQRWPFIYASSASVYGADQNQSDDDERLPGLQPLNPYAWSKLSADRMVIARAMGGVQPPRWAGLRFFNVYGPAEDHKGDQRSFVSKCFDAIRAGEPISLFRGSENYRRDWVSVGDCARLVADLLMRPELDWRGVFNVGTGVAASFTEVASVCIEVSGRITPVATIPFPEQLFTRYQSFTRADTVKLQRLMPDFRFNDLRKGAQQAWAFAQRDGLSRFP